MSSDDRRTGKTFRVTLAALLTASREPNQSVFIAVPDMNRVKFNFGMLKSICLASLTGVAYTRTSVTLPNGSRISVIADTPRSREQVAAGLPNVSFYGDHP